jgi:hypothetical protein
MNPSSSRMQRPSPRSGHAARWPAAAQTRGAPRRADVARRGAPPRRVGLAAGWIQRRQPQKKQSGLVKVLGGLSGAVPRLGEGRAKPARSAGKGKLGGQVGGVALLTAAAGLALKNREKVAALLRRDQQGAPQAGREADVAVSPATPPAADVGGQAPANSPGAAGGNAGPQA